LPAVLTKANAVLYFTHLILMRPASTTDFRRMWLFLDDSPTGAYRFGMGDRFSSDMETEGTLTLAASDGTTLTIPMSELLERLEPYFFYPKGSAVTRYNTFANNLAGLSDKTIHLTFDDNQLAAPEIDIGAHEDTSEIGTLDLQATVTGGRYDTISYVWEVVTGGGSIVGNGLSATYTPPNVTEDTPVTVRITATFSRGSASATRSDTETFTVKVYRPEISLAANPTIVDHAGTSALTATVTNKGKALTYLWEDNIGGAFSDNDGLTTNWTAPSSVTIASVANITFTATDPDGVTTVRTVQVTIRAQTTVPLVAPTQAALTGVTGDVIDQLIAEATGGGSPYVYEFSGLPPELANIGRQIVGRLIAPGAFTVTIKVVDANGDEATSTFTWTVTGIPIAAPAGNNIRIDWGRNNFAHDLSDVTDRITSRITCWRGRNIASAILGRTIAGTLRFQLDNSDGRFDLDNSSSPLHGLIQPGLKIQWRHGSSIIWTGVLDSIPMDYDDSAGEHRANVSGWGIYSTLRDVEISEGSLSAESTAQAFCDVLQNVGTCGLPVGTGFFVMSQWWERGSLIAGLRHIEDTEGGFIYEDRIGNLRFQSAGYRASRTRSKTFSGLAMRAADEIPIAGRPHREIAVKDVRNELIGQIRQFETRTDQVVLQRRAAIRINRGSFVTVRADYEGRGAVSELNTPVSGTDYVVNAQADGMGTDHAADVNVTQSVSASNFNEIEVTVNYPVAPGKPAHVFLTALTVKGMVITNLTPSKVVRQSPASITRYKRRSHTLRDTWILTEAAMAARADGVLSQIDSPENRIKFNWFVEDYADFLSMELSDLIQVKMPNYSGDAYVESLGLSVPLDNTLPVCTVQATFK